MGRCPPASGGLFSHEGAHNAFPRVLSVVRKIPIMIEVDKDPFEHTYDILLTVHMNRDRHSVT